MHELSLCAAIADTATDYANGQPVERISLRIGHFRQVVPETLQYCWSMRSADTAFADCELVVDYVPATIVCGDCGGTTELEHPVLRCGSCDSTTVTLMTGEEFLIESIDITKQAG